MEINLTVTYHGSEAHTLERVESYAVVEIENTSKKRMDEVTVLPDVSVGMFVYQVADGKELEKGERGKKIVLGNLQPGHRVKLHIWSTWDLADHWYSLETLFVVSADEIHDVRYRFPLPTYLERRWGDRRVNAAYLGVLGLLVGGLITVGVFGYYGKLSTAKEPPSQAAPK